MLQLRLIRPSHQLTPRELDVLPQVAFIPMQSVRDSANVISIVFPPFPASLRLDLPMTGLRYSAVRGFAQANRANSAMLLQICAPRSIAA